MATVKSLKILKGVLYADVAVGLTDNGAAVTVNVKVAKAEDPAIREALSQLETAVAAIAERNMVQAATNKVVDKRVQDRVAALRKRHEESLDVQRRTVYANVAKKLRGKLRWVTSENTPDSVRTMMADLALEFDRESERRSA